MEALRIEQPDVLLLDVSMPGINGADLIQRIRLRYPDIRIAILSMHAEVQIATRMLKAGASGYVTKDSNSETLLAAADLFPPCWQNRLHLRRRLTSPVPCMNDRELQIMKLLAKGRGQIEIAEELAISNKTVSTHKTRLMKKMKIASNANLIRYAIMHGFADWRLLSDLSHQKIEPF